MHSYVKAGFAAEISAIPDNHWEFFVEQTLDYWETEERIYVHASVDPDLDMDEQAEYVLFWQPLTAPMVHKSGKQIVCGHTSQKSGKPLVFDGGVCIDTFAHGGGWLSCLDAGKQTVLQTNESGAQRILPALDQRPRGKR
jgi:serine/threonine protein phosphatase 1